ncbi:MAG: DUF3313 domain-containing protein [Planctomycetota bacterium]|jgi:hypothetical protein
MKKVSLLMIVTIVSIAMLSGCSKGRMATTGFLSDYSRLEAESDSSLRYLDKPALASYSSFIVDHVEVHFRAGAKAIEKKSKGKLTERDMADLTNYFHSAIVKATTDAGYGVVYQPGYGVARVRVAITDMEETNVLLAAIPTARVATLAGVGGAAMEAEVVDSLSGKQLAAVVESKAGSRIPFTGLSQWGGAKAAIDEWAKRLRKRLEEARGK